MIVMRCTTLLLIMFIVASQHHEKLTVGLNRFEGNKTKSSEPPDDLSKPTLFDPKICIF